eukprot:scaffold118136_cov32-Prasinocladus_malaysianus.AAC.1
MPAHLSNVKLILVPLGRAAGRARPPRGLEGRLQRAAASELQRGDPYARLEVHSHAAPDQPADGPGPALRRHARSRPGAGAGPQGHAPAGPALLVPHPNRLPACCVWNCAAVDLDKAPSQCHP